ncbi:MAG: sensor histidine kinase, partial [Oscillospiraceae bacterium]|nr:sensor histidine kinase [Oscillospiraceae bacterium]
MKKHIFSRFFIVTSFALLIAAVISAFILGNNMEKKTQHDMLRLLKVMEQGYSRNVNPNDFVKRNSKITDNSRITVIASDGTVIADSHVSPSSMENHLNRTEVKQALSSGWGVSNRNSSTLHKGLMYVAIKSESGDVIRIAQSFDGVFTNISKQVPAIFVALLIALLISLLISKRFSNTITRPFANIVSGLDKVSQGEYQIDFENTKYEELDTITNRIKSLLNEIKSSSSDLDKEREKVNFILDNMEEGLVLVDENQDILTVNNSAKNFFDCSEDVNKRNLVYFTDHIKIQNAVEDAIMKENSSLFDITLPDNRIVSIHTTNVVGKFIQNSKKHIGVIILIVDVSSDRKSHKLRQEFFSNASHELKTPITSIQGFAELIESGMIPDPSMQ